MVYLALNNKYRPGTLFWFCYTLDASTRHWGISQNDFGDARRKGVANA